MRHHFHRCTHLRIVSVPASEIDGSRKGGSAILEELCDARGHEHCVGLEECEILASGQKQDLLVERATRIRAQEGRPTALSGVPGTRGAELRTLRAMLTERRDELAAENARLAAELGAAEALLPGPAARSEEADLARAGVSLRLGGLAEELRVEQLDALDRALEAMERPDYGTCGPCGAPVEIDRLRADPLTRVCAACAGEEPPRPRSPARG